MQQDDARSHVLYVTIDPYNHRDPEGNLRGHQPNLSRLRDAVTEWRREAVVDDLWFVQVDAKVLNDRRLLCLFLSGSYTEWMEVFRQPVWQAQLNAFCEHIRGTDIPILAVCGSHQLVAHAYGGWSAVGHMAAEDAMPISIANESDGRFRASNPRIGEVGTFHYRQERPDPIFTGLTERSEEPLIFSQWHRDEVRMESIPAGAVSLMKPDGLDGSLQRPLPTSLGTITVKPGEAEVEFFHRPIRTSAELCRVQALRYDVPPAGRLLYTTQFHPDLAGTDAAGRQDHGIGFLQNFLRMASDYRAS